MQDAGLVIYLVPRVGFLFTGGFLCCAVGLWWNANYLPHVALCPRHLLMGQLLAPRGHTHSGHTFTHNALVLHLCLLFT